MCGRIKWMLQGCSVIFTLVITTPTLSQVLVKRKYTYIYLKSTDIKLETLRGNLRNCGNALWISKKPFPLFLSGQNPNECATLLYEGREPTQTSLSQLFHKESKSDIKCIVNWETEYLLDRKCKEKIYWGKLPQRPQDLYALNRPG